jgi:hypothetical protein
MAGRAEDIRRWRLLDDLAEIHHRDLVAEALDHAEIMRDEDVGQETLALEALEQIENLHLDGDIEGGHRLVTDDQIWLRCQRTRWKLAALPLDVRHRAAIEHTSEKQVDQSSLRSQSGRKARWKTGCHSFAQLIPDISSRADASPPNINLQYADV